MISLVDMRRFKPAVFTSVGCSEMTGCPYSSCPCTYVGQLAYMSSACGNIPRVINSSTSLSFRHWRTTRMRSMASLAYLPSLDFDHDFPGGLFCSTVRIARSNNS